VQIRNLLQLGAARNTALLDGVPEHYATTAAELGTIRMGRGTANDALRGAMTIHLDGTGPLEHRALVPETRAAHELLTGRNGAAAEDVLRRMLRARTDLSDTTQLRTITFARTFDAFAGSFALREFRDAGTGPQFAARRGIDDTFRDVRSLFVEHGGTRGALAGATTNGGTSVVFDPNNTREFERQVARRARYGMGVRAPASRESTLLATTWAHELQHTSLIRSQHDVDVHGTAADWLLEGAATRAESRFGARVADELGFDLGRPRRNIELYQGYADRMALLAHESGADDVQLDQVLRGASGVEGVDRLIQLVAARSGMSVRDAENLRTTVLHPTPAG
jgi:hypothetical protein